MINDTLIRIVFEFLKIISSFDDLDSFNQFVQKLLALMSGVVSYLPTFKNYLSLVFYFIPKEFVIPLLELSALALLVRIAVSIKKLIV